MMKRIIIFLTILIVISAGCYKQKNKTIQVKINKNVETLFILYPLVDIGMPPVNNSLCEVARLDFKEFNNHKAVTILDTLITRTRIDGPVNLILHFSELPNIKKIYPIDSNMLKSFSAYANADDGQKLIDEFVTEFSDFYNKADLEAFFAKYESYYKKAANDVNKHLPPESFVNTMEQYYGQENKEYILNPSPLLYPGFGFGSRIKTKDGFIIYNTFGALNDLENDSSKILFDFDNYEEIRNLSVHEFGHSFVNPITELPENIERINQCSYLFKPIEIYMSEQAYRSWWTCVTEHLVRLGEIRIALAMNDSITANKIRKENIEQNKFVYLPYLENKILEYENSRDKYHSFSDFFPELINTFSEIDTSKIKL